MFAEAPGPRLKLPYMDEMDRVLGVRLPQVASLARRCDQELRKLNEQRQKAVQNSLQQNPAAQPGPVMDGREAGLAIVESFRRDVLNLLDEQEKTRLQDFLLKEVAKRIKFAKLPSPQGPIKPTSEASPQTDEACPDLKWQMTDSK